MKDYIPRIISTLLFFVAVIYPLSKIDYIVYFPLISFVFLFHYRDLKKEKKILKMTYRILYAITIISFIPLLIFRVKLYFYAYLIVLLTYTFICYFIYITEKRSFMYIALYICESLLIIISSFAKIYEWGGLLNSKEAVYKYYDSLYFSIVTFTTLGYGDLTPHTDIRFFAGIEALLGYIMLGLLITVIIKVLNPKEGS